MIFNVRRKAVVGSGCPWISVPLASVKLSVPKCPSVIRLLLLVVLVFVNFFLGVGSFPRHFSSFAVGNTCPGQVPAGSVHWRRYSIRLV